MTLLPEVKNGDSGGFLFDPTFATLEAPCAIIDAYGRLRATTAAFDSLFGTSLGKDADAPGDALQSTIDRLVASSGTGFMTRQCESGEHVPVVFHTIPLMQGADPCKLLVVSDGAAFRRAEAKRFDCTPCPILRVTRDARITFGNADASCDFAGPGVDLIGRPFTELFEPGDRDNIAAKVRKSIDERISYSLNTSTCDSEHKCARSVHLVITPDFGLDMEPLGALVVVQAAVETIRNMIRKIALEPIEPVGKEPQDAAQHAAQQLPAWQVQFERIVEQIGKLIDFDHVNFGTYDESVTLFRAEALYPADSPAWPARWLSLPPVAREFTEREQTWLDDVDQFVEQDPEFAKSEVVQVYREFGIKSCVSLIVRRGNLPTSALTLCSRKLRKYGEADFKLLQDLELSPILLRYEEEIEAGRRDFCERIRDMLSGDTPIRKAAKKVVNEIATHFSLDYAGLFRVSRDKDVFEVFHQKALNDDLKLPDNYVQAIDKGMLASTLDGKCVRINNDIGNPKVPQFGYFVGERARRPRSAMTAPVYLNDRVRWILDVECEKTHAFHGPDQEALLQVIESVEQSLSRRMLLELKASLMQKSDRGVVIVGMDGTIFSMNDAAISMLGLTRALTLEDNRKLCDFAADEKFRDLLSGIGKLSNRRIELKPESGDANKVVMATCKALDSTFDTAVWFLTDVEEVKWSRDVRFLQEVVSDVAQQTRAPLTLASVLMRELTLLVHPNEKNASGSNDIEARTDEIIAEIGKADMTFERLAEAVKIHDEPMRFKEPVDLRHCVADIISNLPQRDQEHIKFPARNGRVEVSGDEGRLTFAIRSIIGYLLRLRQCDDDPVDVSLTRSKDNVRLVLRAPAEQAVQAVPGATPTDVAARVSREAREAASLSLDAIRKIAKAHHVNMETLPDGTTQPDGSQRLISFQLTFPPA
jgi:PAS domain-containing protein